ARSGRRPAHNPARQTCARLGSRSARSSPGRYAALRWLRERRKASAAIPRPYRRSCFPRPDDRGPGSVSAGYRSWSGTVAQKVETEGAREAASNCRAAPRAAECLPGVAVTRLRQKDWNRTWMFSSGGKRERNRRFGRRWLITLRTGRELRSDHPLLAIGLKVTYDLRNDADQLAGDVGHILLCQLSLLAKGHGTAERRLELRCAELSAPSLRWMAETKLAEASKLLTEA